MNRSGLQAPRSAVYQNTVRKSALVAWQPFAKREESKMAAATARQIPVVNNVITDEDFDNLRTEGKVSIFVMQKIRLVGNHCDISCYFRSILADSFLSVSSKHTNFSRTSTR